MTTNTRDRVLITAAVLMVLATGCGKAPPPPKAPPPRDIEVVTLAPSEVRDTGEYLGMLLSRQSVTVVPQVGGYVRRIHVQPGALVKAGTPIVDIDARQETAALASAQADASAAQARLELAKSKLMRVEVAQREGLAPAQEVDQARADVSAAEAGLSAASAGIAQREVQLDLTTVRAPVAGTLGEVAVRLGDSVTPSTQITTIAPTREPATRAPTQGGAGDAGGTAPTLEVTAAIPAERARTLEPGAPLEVLDAKGVVLARAPIFYSAPHADPRTQLVGVKAAFANTVGLRPSELVRVRIVFGVAEALQVPSIAVLRQSGRPFVFVVAQKAGATVVERKPVQLGRLGEDAYVVEGGLAAGDRVAVSALQMLKEGAAVVPRERGDVSSSVVSPPPPGR